MVPWTIGHQPPLSMEFLRQEYWSGLPFATPGNLPHPGVKPTYLVVPALADGFFTTTISWEAHYIDVVLHYVSVNICVCLKTDSLLLSIQLERNSRCTEKLQKYHIELRTIFCYTFLQHCNSLTILYRDTSFFCILRK